MIYVKQESRFVWAAWEDTRGPDKAKPRKMGLRYRSGVDALKRAAELAKEYDADIVVLT